MYVEYTVSSLFHKFNSRFYVMFMITPQLVCFSWVFIPVFQLLSDQLAQYKEEAVTKVNELQVKLIEMEYNVRKEVSQEFAEQLTEIEDKHMWAERYVTKVFLCILMSYMTW